MAEKAVAVEDANSAKRQTTIAKAVDILHVLASGETRFAQIKRIIGYGNGTTHRLLKNLMEAGLIVQDPATKDYLLSNEILRLATRVEDGFVHISVPATREMERLREISGETVCLCKRIGLRKTIVKEFTSFHGIKFEYGVGYSSAFHSGATGVALMSLLDNETLHKLLDKANLAPETSETLLDPNQIVNRVIEARQNGYAISFGEVTSGTASISAPLREGTSSFALTIVGPSNRFFPKTVLADVLESAQRISAAIE